MPKATGSATKKCFGEAHGCDAVPQGPLATSAADRKPTRPNRGPLATRGWDDPARSEQVGVHLEGHRDRRHLPAQGIQGGLIYTQLFIAPDGETFALWNHFAQYWPEKSVDHAHEFLPPAEKTGEEEKFRGLDIHKKRLIIYRKDGSIVKELGAADFLTPEEWPAVHVAFTWLGWLAAYEGMEWKTALSHAVCVLPGQSRLHRSGVPAELAPKSGPRAPGRAGVAHRWVGLRARRGDRRSGKDPGRALHRQGTPGKACLPKRPVRAHSARCESDSCNQRGHAGRPALRR